jgi:hypothetical protein
MLDDDFERCIVLGRLQLCGEGHRSNVLGDPEVGARLVFGTGRARGEAKIGPKKGRESEGQAVCRSPVPSSVSHESCPFFRFHHSRGPRSVHFSR